MLFVNISVLLILFVNLALISYTTTATRLYTNQASGGGFL